MTDARTLLEQAWWEGMDEGVPPYDTPSGAALLARADLRERVTALEGALRRFVTWYEADHPESLEVLIDNACAILATPAAPVDEPGKGPHRRSPEQDYDPTPACMRCFMPWPCPAAVLGTPDAVVERCGWKRMDGVEWCGLPEDHEIHHPERGNAGWHVHPFQPSPSDSQSGTTPDTAVER